MVPLIDWLIAVNSFSEQSTSFIVKVLFYEDFHYIPLTQDQENVTGTRRRRQDQQKRKQSQLKKRTKKRLLLLFSETRFAIVWCLRGPHSGDMSSMDMAGPFWALRCIFASSLDASFCSGSWHLKFWTELSLTISAWHWTSMISVSVRHWT